MRKQDNMTRKKQIKFYVWQAVWTLIRHQSLELATDLSLHCLELNIIKSGFLMVWLIHVQHFTSIRTSCWCKNCCTLFWKQYTGKLYHKGLATKSILYNLIPSWHDQDPKLLPLIKYFNNGAIILQFQRLE